MVEDVVICVWNIPGRILRDAPFKLDLEREGRNHGKQVQIEKTNSQAHFEESENPKCILGMGWGGIPG